MALEILNCSRKTFDVEAVRVTAENMHELAEWCNGTVLAADTNTYIRVRVRKAKSAPTAPHLTRAYVGDWILRVGHNFKVFRNDAFLATFEPKKN